MRFSERLQQQVEPIIERIYQDEFIQGFVNDDISTEAIKHYLKADARYLNEFAKVYALLIPKVNSKEEIKFLVEQIEFASSGEVGAHQILADYIGEPYLEVIKDGAWYPTADHYIKHMYYNAYAHEHAAYTIAAMAPCPYVYRRLAQMALERNNFSDNHKLKEWFNFYLKGMDELMVYLDGWLNDFSESCSEAELKVVERNFLESTVHERNFFNMAFTKQDWEFEVE
ncbi:thiaminase II [Mammaliicoccus stepanovicii]|uniref:Aminopyrimidine aminohydrolase n=1 Tax=Mammaliicoccus stepanovicii TaxID=643214 RepID=A0A239YQR5_9STAP|nr:thiaminase II [Mammaliicoccus stepanovicii]PNZ78937.1 thiaminase II [Mammaliicoccus stepanovicii]GGI41273.1 aminopyrimidine aminohydrolase [Mammaliicoccus stepanovicii]SNV60554.1 putative thiaminase II [Mammaliicoccus stepanovicii]